MWRQVSPRSPRLPRLPRATHRADEGRGPHGSGRREGRRGRLGLRDAVARSRLPLVGRHGAGLRLWTKAAVLPQGLHFGVAADFGGQNSCFGAGVILFPNNTCSYKGSSRLKESTGAKDEAS